MIGCQFVECTTPHRWHAKVLVLMQQGEQFYPRKDVFLGAEMWVLIFLEEFVLGVEGLRVVPSSNTVYVTHNLSLWKLCLPQIIVFLIAAYLILYKHEKSQTLAIF